MGVPDPGLHRHSATTRLQATLGNLVGLVAYFGSQEIALPELHYLHSRQIYTEVLMSSRMPVRRSLQDT